MKALLLIATTLVVIATIAHGQGTVHFTNGGLQQPVYVCDETSMYPAPLGSAFLVALYYAPDGVTDEAQFTQLGASDNFGPLVGIFAGGSREAPTAIPGDWAMFQVRGWESTYGNSYEEVVNRQLGRTGKSQIVRVDTAHPDITEPAPGLGRYGISFIMSSPNCIPEPHVAIWGLTVSAFLFVLRVSARQRTR